LVGSAAWTFTTTSWGEVCPFPVGMVAQPIKKIPTTATSTKRFNMAKPPHISIRYRVLVIEARFIPKQNAAIIKIYLINFK
jgi:hypothetical protein